MTILNNRCFLLLCLIIILEGCKIICWCWISLIGLCSSLLCLTFTTVNKVIDFSYEIISFVLNTLMIEFIMRFLQPTIKSSSCHVQLSEDIFHVLLNHKYLSKVIGCSCLSWISSNCTYRPHLSSSLNHCHLFILIISNTFVC